MAQITRFAEARRRGARTFYDLPIGYWRAARTLLLEEAEREPEWAVTLSGIRTVPKKPRGRIPSWRRRTWFSSPVRTRGKP